MSQDRFDEAVLKILKLTHEEKLKWRAREVPAAWTKATDAAFPSFFVSDYAGRRLALFEKRSAQLDPLAALGDSIVAQLNAKKIFVQEVHLVLLGPNDENLFEFPQSRIVDGLLDAVRYKSSKIDELLDALLKTEEM